MRTNLANKEKMIIVLRNFTRATLASCRRVSVCPSVTSRCSTETVKRRITQTTIHDNKGTLVFRRQISRQNSNGVTPNGGPKCKWDRLNAVAVAENWQLSTRSVVNLRPVHTTRVHGPYSRAVDTATARGNGPCTATTRVKGPC